MSNNFNTELIKKILSGKKGEAKEILLSEYSDNLHRYLMQKHKIENELKKYFFLHLALKEFIELPEKKLRKIKSREQIIEKLNDITDILCRRFVRGKKTFVELDALFGVVPEIKNKVRQKLLNKPFGKELFSERVHDVIDNRNVVNNIDVKYYLRAFKELPLAQDRKLDGSISGPDKLIRCHDIILLHNVFNNAHKEIAAGLKGIYDIKSERSYRIHLSECMGKLIDLALKLKKDDDDNDKRK